MYVIKRVYFESTCRQTDNALLSDMRYQTQKTIFVMKKHSITIKQKCDLILSIMCNVFLTTLKQLIQQLLYLSHNSLKTELCTHVYFMLTEYCTFSH